MTDVKNDIKILFYIINSIAWLKPGTDLFVSGIVQLTDSQREFSVYNPKAQLIGILVLGLVSLAIAVLGYLGTVLERKRILIVYVCIMVLAILGCMLSLVFAREWRPLSISLLITTVMSMALAILLARRVHQPTDQGMVLGAAQAQTVYAPRM